MRRSTSFAGALLCALACAGALSTAAAQTSPSGAKTPAKAAPSPIAPKSGATRSTPAKPPGAAAATKAAGTQSTPKGAKAAAPKSKPKTNELQNIDWRDLLPETERRRYNPNAPAPIHGPLGEGGPPAVQVVTTTVNKDLDEALVRMPGFIVPLGEPQDGVVREFYLVPYIGEDIHVPPPPSNQMVYVRSATGVAAGLVHEAYWVTGKMRVETRTTSLGTSAYTLAAVKVEQYEY
jgi:uncharacterized protein